MYVYKHLPLQLSISPPTAFSMSVPARSLNGSTYHLFDKKDPTLPVITMGHGWTDRSLTLCTSSCLLNHPPCHAFVYNKSTRLCTPGAYASTAETPPTSIEGSLYVKHVHCDTTAGFKLVTHNDTTLCLNMVFNNVSFAAAESACTSINGFLATADTRDKVRLIMSLAPGSNIWIGCNDRGVEGTFVWVEDGSWVDLNHTSIFLPGEPNNNNISGNENCCMVLTYNSDSWVNDLGCEFTMLFVCEQKM